LPQEVHAARQWALLAGFEDAEAALGQRAVARGPWVAGLYEFLRFGVKQGWACLFGGAMLALLLATHAWYPRHAALPRYDFLTLAAVGLQILLLRLGMETWEEARVILLFHVTGTGMELFKTAVGSWIYPEHSILHIGGVPLFTGFMYASVGSYIARAWRLFDFRFSHHPPLWATGVFAAAIYANFFTHHFIVDVRDGLFVAAVLLFGRSWIYFRVWHRWRRMPLLVGFGLVAVFVWLAENAGTFAGAWLYPHQVGGWAPVPVTKLGSWFLLMLISYVMVSAVNHPRSFDAE
jgi:uncharacterized membrane protein YoaT (DUF817 family)